MKKKILITLGVFALAFVVALYFYYPTLIKKRDQYHLDYESLIVNQVVADLELSYTTRSGYLNYDTPENKAKYEIAKNDFTKSTRKILSDSIYVSKDWYVVKLRDIKNKNYVCFDSTESVLTIKEFTTDAEFQAKSPCSNIYKDVKTGLQLNIPRELAEIGYYIDLTGLEPSRIVTGGISYDEVEYSLHLIYTEPADNTTKDMPIGTFGVMPTAKYVKPICGTNEIICVEPVEVGRNSKFVFLSWGLPPEPFSECIQTGQAVRDAQIKFTNLNKKFCENGPKFRMMERDTAILKVTEPSKE